MRTFNLNLTQWKLPSFRSQYHYGAQATLRVWNATLANTSAPGITHMCSLWPDPLGADPHAVHVPSVTLARSGQPMPLLAFGAGTTWMRNKLSDELLRFVLRVRG